MVSPLSGRDSEGGRPYEQSDDGQMYLTVIRLRGARVPGNLAPWAMWTLHSASAAPSALGLLRPTPRARPRRRRGQSRDPAHSHSLVRGRTASYVPHKQAGKTLRESDLHCGAEP